jgi:hypothetical protein
VLAVLWLRLIDMVMSQPLFTAALGGSSCACLLLYDLFVLFNKGCYSSLACAALLRGGWGRCFWTGLHSTLLTCLLSVLLHVTAALCGLASCSGARICFCRCQACWPRRVSG